MRVSLVKCRSCRTGCSCTAETGICTVPWGAVRNTCGTPGGEGGTRLSVNSMFYLNNDSCYYWSLTWVLALSVDLHGRCAVREGVEHSETPVGQRGRRGVHHCVRAGVHHVTRNRCWHRRGDDGCWETNRRWKERKWGRGKGGNVTLRAAGVCSHVGQQMALYSH